MARTELTVRDFDKLMGAIAANQLDAVESTIDTANGNSAIMNGPLLILVRNIHASSAFTFTLTSAADSLGRSGDIAAYSLHAGDLVPIFVKSIKGWQQADGRIYFTGSDATNLKVSVYKLPAGF